MYWTERMYQRFFDLLTGLGVNGGVVNIVERGG
jgi:hypothetical protein